MLVATVEAVASDRLQSTWWYMLQYPTHEAIHVQLRDTLFFAIASLKRS